MNEEILKLLYNYSINSKYADQDFYDELLIIFSKYNSLSEYLMQIKIDNKIKDLGIYDYKSKTIKINNIEVLNNSDQEIELLSLRNIDEFFLLNIEAILTVLHEFEHVYQSFIVDRRVFNLEEQLIYYGLAFSNASILAKFFGTKYTKEELNYLYDLTYEFNPIERLADINSYKNILQIINYENKINNRIKFLLKYLYEKNKLSGYKIIQSKIECPSYLYFKKLNKLADIKNISFNSSNNSLNYRLSLGIEITEEEFNETKNNIQKLKKKIL